MKKTQSDEDRFWEKVIPEPNSGCWLWLGALSGGYGRFGIGSRTDGSRRVALATRFVWVLINGKIAEGLGVLHKCDNKACVNPDHLYLGTQHQNMQDAYDRGQKKAVVHKGSLNPSAKINDDDVRAIRSSALSVDVLAKTFSLSRDRIKAIRAHRAWAHVA